MSVAFSVPVASIGLPVLSAGFSADADFSRILLMKSKMVRAPASAFWPSATATLPPVTQASGWRSQNPRTSETAAVAIVTASEASIFASVDDDLLPLGNSMQTRHSQNASRNRKNMTQPVIGPGSLLLPLS